MTETSCVILVSKSVAMAQVYPLSCSCRSRRKQGLDLNLVPGRPTFR